MTTAILFLALIIAIGYLVQRYDSKHPSLRPQLFGSASFEDRDIARISHDLQR